MTECSLQIQENVPLAPLTTLGVGGAARFLAVIENEAQLAEAETFRRKHHLSGFVLGGGSNLVVADEGFAGLVLKIAIPGIEADSREQGRVVAGAGVEWDEFVQYCVSRDLAGVESLSGIPGMVGSAPIQNIGAYGHEVGNTIANVQVWDTENDTCVELSREQCRFGYRESIFNTPQASGRYIVLRVTFELQPQGAPNLQYAELSKRLAGKANPSLREVRDVVLVIRKSKGMVFSQDDSDSKSAGSFFKNPVISENDFARLHKQIRNLKIIASEETIPCFDAPGANVKLSAAWLIEHAGFCKGYALGRAGISGKHSLALVNRGGASAEEIINLMKLIQKHVRETFDIQLQPEPVFVGFN